MKKISIVCLFAATFLFSGLSLFDSRLDDGKALAAAKAVPQWIWLGNPPDSNETVYFRHTFELTSVPKSVTVAGSCDNSMRVYINGKKAVSSNEWSTPVRAEIAKSLVKGKNVIAVEAVNSGGPGGLILSVDSWKSRPRGDKKGSPILSTSPAWKASRKAASGWKVTGFNDSEWRKSTSLAEIGGGPWGASVNSSTLVNAGAPPKPVQATAPDSLIVAPGFKVELLYSVPKGSEGSWVTLTVDPKGRLIASDQYGALYRITPSPIGEKGETVVERLAGNAGHAHGLLYAFDSLYVVQSEKERGLYRMRDTNGDGQFDDRKLLRSIQGGGEHGPHAVILGPEKKYIYVIGGNHTNLPNPEKSLVPRTWKEDLLLPRLWDARGHARGKLAPGGWIARTDPEGKIWELVSNGYRNQYDIAFNKNGELFTYDADMEWDVGTPWYRPTRVNHVISGGEFGWRSGTGKWPTYYPDSLGRVVDVGPGSPTGIGFGYGADFPVKYQEALYICDWSYGKLYAVHMTPDGGTYTGELEQFIAGAPFPLTDVIVNPKDKALYVSVGGRRTQSGLYRVTYTGNDKGGVAKTSPESTKLRAQRKELEKYHGKQDPAAIEAAWPHLSSPDRYLRYAARIAVEHQPVDSWQDKVIGELNDVALIQGAIALARHGKAEIRPKLLAALRNIKASSLDETQLINLLRAYSLVFIRLGKPAEATGAKIAAELSKLYPAKTAPLNRELSQVLIYLEAPGVAGKTVALMETSPAQEDQMHYALALHSLKTGWTIEERKRYFKWFSNARGFRGGASFNGFINNVRSAAIGRLSAEDKKTLAAAGSLKNSPAPALLAQLPKPKGPGKEWTAENVLPAIEKGLVGRDFEHGKKMFAAAKCFVCHRFDGQGGAAGPDLTGAAGRFSKRDLLESILAPDKVVSDQYRATIFILKNGKTVTGRIVNGGGDNFSVNTNMLTPASNSGVNHKQILKTMPAKGSMMPAGLLNPLNKEEVLDLVAYLLSMGNPDHAMFKQGK